MAEPFFTIPRFVSVQFYPAYETSHARACGRYIALGEDGRVYVSIADKFSKWELVGELSYD